MYCKATKKKLATRMASIEAMEPATPEERVPVIIAQELARMNYTLLTLCDGLDDISISLDNIYDRLAGIRTSIEMTGANPIYPADF